MLKFYFISGRAGADLTCWQFIVPEADMMPLMPLGSLTTAHDSSRSTRDGAINVQHSEKWGHVNIHKPRKAVQLWGRPVWYFIPSWLTYAHPRLASIHRLPWYVKCGHITVLQVAPLPHFKWWLPEYLLVTPVWFQAHKALLQVQTISFCSLHSSCHEC